MALDPNWHKDAKKPSELNAIVQSIAEDPNSQESDFIEWKSGYDLSTRFYAAKTAKQLIGFANREPKKASRFLDGHAYLFFGLEAGQIAGIDTVWDSADIESWLSPFLQPELTYEIKYLKCDQRDVLLFKVAPPQQGDPIFALQQSTGNGKEHLAEGTIYVRHGGKTERNTAADLAMLTNRAAPRTSTSSLSLVMHANATRLVPLEKEKLGDTGREQYLSSVRKSLLAALPRPRGRFDITIPTIGEFRSEDEFRREVDEFTDDAGARWETFCIWKQIEAVQPEVALTAENCTEENFEAVVIEVSVPMPRERVHLGISDAEDFLQPPTPPRKWGVSPLADLHEVVPLSSGAKIEPLSDEVTLIRFQPFHAYPLSTHDLSPFLVVPFSAAETTIELSWRAVARYSSGDLRGEVVVQPGASPIE